LATRFCFHPLVQASIGFETTNNAGRDFVPPRNQLVGVCLVATPTGMGDWRERKLFASPGPENEFDLLRGFLRENPRAKTETHTSTKGRVIAPIENE
jgi:hypothetical protein